MSDQEVIDQVRLVADMVGPELVNLRAVQAHTSLQLSEVIQRFGSLNGLRAVAGLPPISEEAQPREAREILNLLRAFVDQQGPNLTAAVFYRETGVGKFDVYTHFGSWTKLRVLAGLQPHVRSASLRYTHEDLMEDLARVYDKHGELIFTRHRLRGGKISGTTFLCRFGSWSNTKLEFEKYRRKKKRPGKKPE